MSISANGLRLIQAFEQLRLKPYLDTAHIWTVGWGHALTTPHGQLIDADIFGSAKAEVMARDAMQREFGKQEITQQEADAKLATDVEQFVSGVTKGVAADTTQAQLDAMICFAFNVGLGNFNISSVKRLHNAGVREIGSISIHDLNAKAKAKAACTTMPLAFVRWCNSNGEYTLGLFRRRVAEVLVYSGWTAKDAYATAEAYND